MLGMTQGLCSLLKVHKKYLKQPINNSASFTSKFMPLNELWHKHRHIYLIKTCTFQSFFVKFQFFNKNCNDVYSMFIGVKMLTKEQLRLSLISS